MVVSPALQCGESGVVESESRRDGATMVQTPAHRAEIHRFFTTRPVAELQLPAPGWRAVQNDNCGGGRFFLTTLASSLARLPTTNDQRPRANYRFSRAAFTRGRPSSSSNNSSYCAVMAFQL